MIGHSEVSISHKGLQIFHRDLNVFHRDTQVSVQWSTMQVFVVYSKLVKGLVQWSLCSLETLRSKVVPSLCSGRYSLRPSGIGSVNHIETLDSASIIQKCRRMGVIVGKKSKLQLWHYVPRTFHCLACRVLLPLHGRDDYEIETSDNEVQSCSLHLISPVYKTIASSPGFSASLFSHVNYAGKPGNKAIWSM